MALEWMKMDHDLPDKAEVIRMNRVLGKPGLATVCGGLFLAWRWADRQSDDGTVEGLPEDLDDAVGIDGFADAMIQVGWLVSDRGALCFPGYTEKHGDTAKRRAQGARRQSRYAARKRGCPDATLTQERQHTDATLTQQRHQEPEPEPEGDFTPVDIPAASGGDTPDSAVGFDAWWAVYPRRNGKRGNKGQARTEWCKLDIETRRRVYFATKHLAHAVAHDGALAPDAQRFLTPPSKRAGADPRWLEWEDAKPEPKRTANDRHLVGANGMDVLEKLQKREDAMRAAQSPSKAKQA